MEVSNQLAKQLLDAVPDASLIVDTDGIVVYTNARVLDVLGYQAEELVDQHIEVLLPERFHANHREYRGKFLSNPRLRPMGSGMDLCALSKNGEEIPVEISLNPVSTDAGTLVFATLRDVSEQKRLERELLEASRAKSRFLAAASHDLRQPIQALNLLNRAASKAPRRAIRRAIIQKQQQSLDSIARLLNALLDISKLEAGIVKPDIKDCKVQEIFDEVRTEFEEQAREKGLELIVERCTGTARSDERLLTQVLENFISNAIRYTHKGLVRLRCRHNNPFIRLEVLDTGLGIPQNQLDSIFEEFYQLETGDHRPEGLGLGLSIVKRTSELLGCEIDADSTIGQGSIFSITVPEGDHKAVSVREPVHGMPATANGGRILVVDDEPAVLDATSMFLTAEGFDVQTAASLEAALACVRASEHAPDLLISDYHLRGDSTGIEVAESLRELVRADMPVIIVSGDTSDSARLYDLANTYFLSKPVDIEQLLAEIQRQLSQA